MVTTVVWDFDYSAGSLPLTCPTPVSSHIKCFPFVGAYVALSSIV